jgi:glycosyltransferase involved in cell wall biosynthesis
MRILLVAHAFPPTIGGVETHLWDVAQTLSARGHQIACLVGGAPSSEHIAAPGAPIHVIRHPALQAMHLVGARAGLAAHEPAPALERALHEAVAPVIAAFRPTLIHMHNAHHFAPELAQIVLENAGDTPTINSVHDRVGEHLYPAVLQEDWAAVLYASAYLRDHLPSRRRMVVRHLSVDLEIFRPDGAPDPRLAALPRPILFHPARLLRWKGIATGLEAFIALRAHFPAASLVLCDSTLTVDDQGEIAAFRRELESRAAAAGVAHAVHFLHFSRAQMPAAYRAADLVWYPTTDEEPLGLVPLEAMACFTRLVVSRSGGMVETVTDGQTGLIVPRGDAPALAIAARRLLEDDNLSQRLRGAGRNWVQRCAASAYTDDLEALYAAAIMEHADG